MNNEGFGVAEILLLIFALSILAAVMKDDIAALFSFLISGIR